VERSLMPFRLRFPSVDLDSVIHFSVAALVAPTSPRRITAKIYSVAA
jgi:hypothetical protein